MAALSWQSLLEPLAEAPRPSVAVGRREGTSPAPPPVPAVDPDALRAEAEAALLSARAEAAGLVEDAQIQAETLRAAAWQEGFHAGREEAQASVEAELRAAWTLEKDTMRAEMDALTRQIGEAREALWLSQEADMVGLALDIARQVVKAEIAQNPDVVRQVIANALRRISDKDNVRVRVSVGDAPRVKEMRDELLEIVDGLRHLEIVDDRRVGAGGCVIETNAGTIDAKIETQLAEVARALGVTENG